MDEIGKHQEVIAVEQEAIKAARKSAKLLLETITIFEKSKNIVNGPFLLVDNTNSLKKSTPQTENKGVETLKKHCYKRKDGRWEYSRVQNGFLYYAIAKTYRALIEKISSIVPRKKNEVRKIKTSGKLTVITYFEFFYDSYIQNRELRKSTKQEWRTMIENYIKPNFLRVEMEKLTTEQVQRFINGIKKETTRGKIYQKVKKVLLKAFVTGKLKRDITAGLEKPRQKNKQVRSPMTLEEQKLFLMEAKKSKIWAFCMFSIIIGSRREETLKFSMAKDLDENKQTIHIRGTKTRNADRFIRVTKEFIAFLKKNMAYDGFNMHPTTATKMTKEIFNAIGVEKSLHELRHTCSANLYFLGAKDKFRQLYLGHASIVMTNDIYTNIKENIPKSALRELYGDLYLNFDDNFDDNFFTK